MKLTIKNVQRARERDNCFCGKSADYNVQLTNSKDCCPVCKSCLMDRLNKPGQSLQIKDDVFLQAFNDDKSLFIVKRIPQDSSPSYTVSFYPNNIIESMAVVSHIPTIGKANKILKELSTLVVNWQELKEQGSKHESWKLVKEFCFSTRKIHGLL